MNWKLSHKSTKSDTSFKALLIIPVLQVDSNPLTQMDEARPLSREKNNKHNPEVDYHIQTGCS